MVDFIPGMALLHLTKGTESLGSGNGSRATTGRRRRHPHSRPVADPVRRHRFESGHANASAATEPPRASSPDSRAPDPEPRTPSSEPRAGEHSEPITCGFCGKPFVEDRSQATCQACPLSKGCGLMRCPHCGYENAKEPGWLSRIKEWIG